MIVNSASIKIRTITILSLIVFFIGLVNTTVFREIQTVENQVQEQLLSRLEQRSLVDQQLNLIKSTSEVSGKLNLINSSIKSTGDMNYWYFMGALTLLNTPMESGAKAESELRFLIEQLKTQDTTNAQAFEELLTELDLYSILAKEMFVSYDEGSISMGMALAEGLREQHEKIAVILGKLNVQYEDEQSMNLRKVVSDAQLIVKASQSQQERDDLISAQVSRSSMMSFVATVILVLFCLVAGTLFLRGVLRPISVLSTRIKEIESNNDFTLRIDYRRKDEMAEIAFAFDLMIEKFQKSLSEINTGSVEVRNLAEESFEFSSQISDSIKVQQEQVELLAAASTEMYSSAIQIKDNTASSSIVAREVTEAASQGREIIEANVVCLSELYEDIAATANDINNLKAFSEEITTVLEVISSISEKTNLLALNAAIEAARAGEQGRGFSVVADEVRNLANSTMASTADIRETVIKLELGASSSVRSITRSQENSQRNLEELQKASEIIGSVANSVGDIAKFTYHIAESSEEQSRVAREIDTSINSVSDQIGDLKLNLERSEQTANSLRSLSENTKSLVDGFVA